MKNVLKIVTCPHSARANVVDGKLILSFPDAIAPVVWQMDLTQAKASALEVLEGKKEGTYTLTLKNPKGETVEIASFERREQAVDGLMSASKALENAHGQIRPASANDSGTTIHHGQRRRRPWLTVVFGIIVVFVLINVWAAMQPDMISTLDSGGSASTGFGSPPANTTGVPMSADDFLRGQ